MLPFLLFDLTASTSVYEGYNDNVVETRPAPGMPSERRGAPFTGGELSLVLSNSGLESSWHVRLGGRGNYYTPPSGQLVGGNDGAVVLSGAGSWVLDPVSAFSTAHSVTYAEQNTARMADMPLLTLDPSIGRQTFVFIGNDVAYRREMSSHSRLRVALGSGIRYLLSDTAFESPGRGWDYAGPRGEAEWAEDLSSADTGAIRVLVGMWNMPRALLDLSGRRGRSETWQVTPLAVWNHAHSESLTTEVTGGISFSTTKNEVTTRSRLAPSFSAQLNWLQDERFAQLAYGLGINTDNIALGPGLAHSVRGQYGGALGRTHAARRLVGGLTARVSRSYIPTTRNTEFVAVTAGAGGILRYALGGYIGLLIGYEGQYLNMRQDGFDDGPSTTFYRNVVYVGLSGTVSTSEGFVPLDIPRPPAR